jgi:hypothetical protein
LTNGKLLYHDLSSKRVTEVDLASVTNVRVNKRTTFDGGAEGGIGFQNDIVLETSNYPVILPVPLLEISAQRAAAIVAANVPPVSRQTR